MAHRLIKKIEDDRQEMDLPVERLCRAAEVSPTTYFRLRAGKSLKPQGATVQRLRAALDRLAIDGPSANPMDGRRIEGEAGDWFLVTVEPVRRAAGKLQMQKRQPMEQAEVRRLVAASYDHVQALAVRQGMDYRTARPVALYLMQTALNLPLTLVAIAARCSKQNAARRIAMVEDRRDDPAFDALVERIEREIDGRSKP